MSMPVQTFRYPRRAGLRRQRDEAIVRLAAASCLLALVGAAWIGLSAAF